MVAIRSGVPPAYWTSHPDDLATAVEILEEEAREHG